MHFFYAGSKQRPDSVLVVGRIELAEGHEMHDIKDLMDYVYRSMKISEEQFDALVDSGAMDVSSVSVGDYEAFETCMPAPTPGEPSTHTLTLPGGRFLIVLVLLNMDDMAASADATWRYLVGSLQVKEVRGFLQRATLYGAIALALLLLLVVVVRSLASSQRRRRLQVTGPGIRAADGLPDRLESFDDMRAQPAAARTLPSSEVADVPPPAPPPVPEPVPQAAPPPMPGLPEVPSGGRLLPTLPPSGRWET